MELEVIRSDRTTKRTIGRMYVDGCFECYTLEDAVHDGPKIYGATAIPSGTYSVTITHSPHFGTELPLIMDVPNFSGIRIHAGNSAADTAGCILVGQSRTEDTVLDSRMALAKLQMKIASAINHGGSVSIVISNR